MDRHQRRTLRMIRSRKKKGFRRVTGQGWLSLKSKKTKGNMITVLNVSIEYRRE